MNELLLSQGRVEAAWWGPPPEQAPTLVLLHEGLGCVKLWRDFPVSLQAETGCGVLAYSRFGYGDSASTPLPRPMTYMHEEAINVLPEVLDTAAVRQAIVIGHSDGGSIAAIHAGATQDARLAGIVMVAAHFFVEDLNIAAIEQIKETYDSGDLRSRLARYHRNVDVAFHGWNGAWLDPRFRAFDITGYLKAIGIPILGLQGEDDPYGSSEQLRILEQHVTGRVETRLISGARHAPHLETPAETLSAIVGFVRSILA